MLNPINWFDVFDAHSFFALSLSLAEPRWHANHRRCVDVMEFSDENQ